MKAICGLGALGLLASVALGLGCGDSEGGTGGAGAGAADCPSEEPVVVLPDVQADHLDLTGDTLVFIDRREGSPFPTGAQGGAIRAVSRDGTNDRILYTSGVDRLLLSIHATADAVYFLEDTFVAGQADDVALHYVPLAGGPSVLVTSLARAMSPVGTKLLAVESDAAYINMGDDGLLRVSLPGGTIASITSERVLHNAHVVGDDVFYSAGPSIGTTVLTRIAKSATDQTGTPLLDADCAEGLATSRGIFCRIAEAGQAKAIRYELDGSGPTTLVDLEKIQDYPGWVVAGDETNIYVVASDLPTLDGHPIWRIPVAGGSKTAAVCDRHEFTFQSSPYPTNTGRREQLIIGATELFWVERRTEGGPIAIFRAPK